MHSHAEPCSQPIRLRRSLRLRAAQAARTQHMWTLWPDTPPRRHVHVAPYAEPSASMSAWVKSFMYTLLSCGRHRMAVKV